MMESRERGQATAGGAEAGCRLPAHNHGWACVEAKPQLRGVHNQMGCRTHAQHIDLQGRAGG